MPEARNLLDKINVHEQYAVLYYSILLSHTRSTKFFSITGTFAFDYKTIWFKRVSSRTSKVKQNETSRHLLYFFGVTVLSLRLQICMRIHMRLLSWDKTVAKSPDDIVSQFIIEVARETCSKNR